MPNGNQWKDYYKYTPPTDPRTKGIAMSPPPPPTTRRGPFQWDPSSRVGPLGIWPRGAYGMGEAQVSPSSQPNWLAQQVLQAAGITPPSGVTFAEPTQWEQMQATLEAADVDLGAGAVPTGIGVPPMPIEAPPEGFRWAFDRELNRWVPQFTGLTAQQLVEQEEEQQQREFQAQQLAQQQAQFEAQMAFEQQQAQQAFQISPAQQQGFDIQQQQMAQQAAQQQAQYGLQQQQLGAQQTQFEASLAQQQAQAQMVAEEQQRQYMSQLAGQPISWLQYASYTGEAPLVQPWMIPLGAQGAETNLQVGQPLLQAGQSLEELPQLRTPSAQLQARWGPTAQAQYLGYQQAETGALPEETQFRLGTGRAPAGRFTGFSRFR